MTHKEDHTPRVDAGEAAEERFRRDRRRSLRIEGEPGVAKPNVKIAETPEEFEAAFRVLHDVYVQMGYMEPDCSGLRMLPHHALPETHVFLARDERAVLGTASLVLDSSFGLPMDDLYRQDLEPLRAGNKKLAEVSSMAVREEYRRLVIDEEGRRRGLFWLLHQAVLYWAQKRKVDHLCVTVNPKHVRFYQYLYFFDRVGEVKPYGTVKGAPAVALHLDLDALPSKLKTAVEDSEKACDLATFFYRFEHGFFNGEKRLPGMPPAIARELLVNRTGIFRGLSKDRADLLAGRLGFRDREHLLAGV